MINKHFTVTLIDPYIITKKFNITTSTSLPLGIAYLASFLRSKGITINLIDSIGEGINKFETYQKDYIKWGLNEKEIIKRIDKDTNLIGLSNARACQHNVCLKIIKNVKKNYSNIPLVMGGVHATESYNAFLDAGVDYVILGEGETSFYELCKRLEKNEDVSKIDGIAYKKGKKTMVNPKTRFIKDLDELPFPARDLFPLKNYFNSKLIHSPVNGNHTPLISSRGCPCNCSFCSIPLFWKGTWRGRKPKNVVDEMKECINKYDIKEFHFMDDNLTHLKKRTEELCYEIIKRKLNVDWSCSTGIRSENLDKNLLRLMKKAGCGFIALSPESGSKRLLKEVYNKSLDLEHINDMIRYSHKIGIHNCAYFVVGSESETDEDREQTKRYIIRLARSGLDEMGVFVMMAHPNTKISKNLYQNRINVGRWEDLVLGTVPLSHKKKKFLNKYKRELYIHFYLNQIVYHPDKMIRILKNFIRGKQETKTDRALLLIIKTFLRKLGFSVKI